MITIIIKIQIKIYLFSFRQTLYIILIKFLDHNYNAYCVSFLLEHYLVVMTESICVFDFWWSTPYNILGIQWILNRGMGKTCFRRNNCSWRVFSGFQKNGHKYSYLPQAFCDFLKLPLKNSILGKISDHNFLEDTLGLVFESELFLTG